MKNCNFTLWDITGDNSSYGKGLNVNRNYTDPKIRPYVKCCNFTQSSNGNLLSHPANYFKATSYICMSGEDTHFSDFFSNSSGWRKFPLISWFALTSSGFRVGTLRSFSAKHNRFPFCRFRRNYAMITWETYSLWLRQRKTLSKYSYLSEFTPGLTWQKDIVFRNNI
jgi:hypothetical protein